MSLETSHWLNNQTLIGCTEKRGMAWHYREEMQGDEPNHYPQFVPVPDVLRRLFNFEVIEVPLYLPDGNGGFTEIPNQKAMIAEDTRDVFGIFKGGYAGHRYQDWLIKNVATILDDDLGIGSAGLLKNRAQAWVSVEVPDTITTPEGVEFRPNLLACTSFDGSLATTYKRCIQNVVCDNTLAAGLSEGGQVFRLKHSRYSGMRIAEAREALAVVHTISDEFAAEVARLTAWKVETREWNQLLDAVVPIPEIPAGKKQEDLPAGAKRSLTMAMAKQDDLRLLWKADPRVAPWKNTAFGVLQAFNTWSHHVQKGVTSQGARAQRNMVRAISGETANVDSEVLAVLAGITGKN